MATKRVILDANFVRAAASRPADSLAYMIVSSFGVSLFALIDAVMKIIETKNTDVAMLVTTAAVNIRGNVSFVGPNYANVQALFPIFIIDSARSTGDNFNFSALHAAGHLLAKLSSHEIAMKVLTKAGNCIDGTTFPDTPAGKINSEIARSWSKEERDAVSAINLSDADKKFLNDFYSSIGTRASTFSTSMKPSVASTAPFSSEKKG